jgi:tRNA threonylcarbamoyl adenosine modification protein YeaZ
MSLDTATRPILAIDCATTRVVIAIGSAGGVVMGATDWPASYRHGETLLPNLERILDEQGVRRSDIDGIVVGTGPGAFTGLRVGIATAKGLAHGLGIPLVGVSTAEALLAAAAIDRAVLILPAGPSDRIIVRPGDAARLLPGGDDPQLVDDEVLVAVDLPDRAPADASARGAMAQAGLAVALLRIGAPLLVAAAADAAAPATLAGLVPEYVTLPRGARPTDASIAWSRDHR